MPGCPVSTSRASVTVFVEWCGFDVAVGEAKKTTKTCPRHRQAGFSTLFIGFAIVTSNPVPEFDPVPGLRS